MKYLHHGKNLNADNQQRLLCNPEKRKETPIQGPYTSGHLKFKAFQGYLKKKFKTVLTTYVLSDVNLVNIKILIKHIFLCIGFSFSSCYLS